MARARWRLSAILAAGLAAWPGGAAPDPGADPYQAAVAAARGQAETGRWDRAAGVLSAAAVDWPQDYPLQLERAYYLLRAGRYDEAAEAYRAALALSPGSVEAHRGLEDARAGRGAASQWWVGLLGLGTGWQGHDTRTSLATGVLSLEGLQRDRWTLGLLYRGMAAPSAAAGGGGRRGAAGTVEVTHEGQATLGYTAPSWSLTLHGGATSRAAAVAAGVEQVYAYAGAGAALAATLRLGLEWRASAAWLSWEDGSSGQVEAAAALPIGHHLSLHAGWRGQRLDGAVTGAALAGLEWRGPWSLALRGEYGEQRRPWDLRARALYGLPEELLAAARLEAGLPFSPRVRGWLGADLERWRTAAGAAEPEATAYRLGAGLIFSL
jgi:hypothetical protein